MTYAIRRLTFGEVFDQSFRLMRDHFLQFSGGLVATYVLLSGTSEAAAGGRPMEARRIIVMVVQFAVIVPFLQFIVTIMAADAYVSKPTSFKTAFERAKGIYLRYLGTGLLAMTGLSVGLVLLLLPAIYLFTAWAFVDQICALEHRFGFDALRRSRELVRGHFWRTFAALSITLVASVLVSTAIKLLFAFSPSAAAVVSHAIRGVTMAYLTVLSVVLYFDLRCRHEDFDLQLMAQEIRNDRPLPSVETGDAAP